MTKTVQRRHTGDEMPHFAMPKQSKTYDLSMTEIYGFVGWAGSFLLFVILVIWAYVPETILNNMGITYYPDKFWALSIPAFLCTTMALSGVAYIGLNMLTTAPLESMETISDSFAKRQCKPLGTTEDDIGRGGAKSIPHFGDLDIEFVNRILYHDS